MFLLTIIFPNDIIIDKPQIKEEIIKETYYGYHHLRAVSERQSMKVVYAPDTTPHAYPSWPYNHVFGRDTLLYEADYHFLTIIEVMIIKKVIFILFTLKSKRYTNTVYRAGK